jgi:Ca2+/Na+ antiporter
MNATLLAMTNSAAESFIIMNSIFFNVSDIGVYTVVGETAFYSLIIQGAFYIFADINTKIDWWIITRETIFLLFYVGLFSGFLYGNKIEIWKASFLMVFYLVHIIMMVLNQYYEVAIKKAAARHYELREKSQIIKKDIHYFQKNDENMSRKITCDMLKNVRLTMKDKCIVYEDGKYRERLKEFYLKIFIETEGGKGINQFRHLVSHIIMMIQAYKFNLKVQRSKKCKTNLSKIIKFYEDEYCMSESESVNPEEFESYEASKSEKGSILSKQQKLKMTESGNIGAIRRKVDDSSEKNEAEKEFDEFEDDMSSNEGEEKTIYDRINERVNKKVSLKFPVSSFDRILYVVNAPLVFSQYFTVPNPMVPGKENFYPLTLFMSISWIFGYTFIIVWWTYELSIAWDINLSIIPLIIYPIGISIRDRKKLFDFRKVKKLFEEELPDQEISLAETFSGPIFQLTGLVGFTWLIKILMSGENIEFENSNIQFQAPLLLLCIFVKYISVLISKFRTQKKLFLFNIIVYILFTMIALIIDYYDSF